MIYNNSKGMTLLEILVAALFVVVIATIAGSVYSMQGPILKSASQSLQAINYAEIAIARVFSEIKGEYTNLNTDGTYSSGNEYLMPGQVYNKDNAPDICELADGAFKNELEGEVEYTVTPVITGRVMIFWPHRYRHIYERGSLRIDMTASWQHSSTDSSRQSLQVSFFSAPYSRLECPPDLLTEEEYNAEIAEHGYYVYLPLS